MTVDLDGVRLVESARPQLLFETNLPVRAYLPREDVRMDLLRPSETVTMCPYKGRTEHFSAQVEGALHDDVAWSYVDTLDETARLAGWIAFYNERTDVALDGEPLGRPQTRWSRR